MYRKIMEAFFLTYVRTISSALLVIGAVLGRIYKTSIRLLK